MVMTDLPKKKKAAKRPVICKPAKPKLCVGCSTPLHMYNTGVDFEGAARRIILCHACARQHVVIASPHTHRG